MYGELKVTINEGYSMNAELLRDGTVFTKGKVYDVIHQMEHAGALEMLLITNSNKFMWLSVNRVNPYTYTPLCDMVLRNDAEYNKARHNAYDELRKRIAHLENISLVPNFPEGANLGQVFPTTEETQVITLLPENQVPAEEGSLEEIQSMFGATGIITATSPILSGIAALSGSQVTLGEIAEQRDLADTPAMTSEKMNVILNEVSSSHSNRTGIPNGTKAKPK